MEVADCLKGPGELMKNYNDDLITTTSKRYKSGSSNYDLGSELDRDSDIKVVSNICTKIVEVGKVPETEIPTFLKSRYMKSLSTENDENVTENNEYQSTP